MCPNAQRAIGAIISLTLLCYACSDVTASQRVTADGTAIVTAQADQYRRDAQATGTARAVQYARDLAAVANTAIVATSTSAALQAQQTADARAVSTATARVEAQMTATQEANATATARAELADAQQARVLAQQATATASVRGTQTALDLAVRASEAERAVIVNRWGVVFLAILSAVCIWIFYALMRAMYIRAQLVHYGPARNPLILLPNGAIYDPISKISSGEEIPPELQAQLANGFQQVLALQAQHSPHPPARAELSRSNEWRIGPVSSKQVTAPVATSVDKVAPQALPVGNVPKIASPKDKMHLVFVENANMDPSEKKLFDLRELVEGSEIRGLTRAKWEGHRFATGNECTQGYHRELVEILVAAQVVAQKGKTHIMRVDTAQAIETLGLQAYDYR